MAVKMADTYTLNTQFDIRDIFTCNKTLVETLAQDAIMTTTQGWLNNSIDENYFKDEAPTAENIRRSLQGVADESVLFLDDILDELRVTVMEHIKKMVFDINVGAVKFDRKGHVYEIDVELDFDPEPVDE